MIDDRTFLLVENPNKSLCGNMNRDYNVLFTKYKNIIPIVQNGKLFPIVRKPAKNLIIRTGAHFQPAINYAEFLDALKPEKLIFICVDNTVGMERYGLMQDYIKRKGFYFLTSFPQDELPKSKLYNYMIKEVVCDANAFGKLGTKNNLRNIKNKDIGYAYWGAPKVRRKALLDDL